MKRFAILLTLLPAPALAGTWEAPEGCTIFLTVQAKACRVSNHYTCTQDQKGDQWRADFDQEGLFFQSRINFEAEWVESLESNPPVQQTLDPNPEDPASFSALLASGYDSFAFGLSRTDGTRTRVAGSDQLTGKKVEIDGVSLLQTQFEATEMDEFGSVTRRSRGNEYISAKYRVFFAGPGETDLGDGQWLPIDGSPVDFIFPGEKGFAATQPIFDCDALTAELPMELPVWQVRHEP